jgi:hypothetical protein
VKQVSPPAGAVTDRKTFEAAPAGPRSTIWSRGAAGWVGLLVVLVTAVIGSNVFAVRDHLFGTATPKAAPPAVGRVQGAAPAPNTLPVAPTSLRSQPWWQDVTTLDGVGTASPAAFNIASGAIQFRVTWTCDTGHLQVRSAAKPAKPIVDGACPGGAAGYSDQTGTTALQVMADGPWHLTIAQQIDSPLVEPPLPGMTAPGASAISSGTFYNIDKTATGKVTVYRQADGSYAVRLDDFFVSPTSDLELRFSSLDAPHSSPEVENAASGLVSVMDVTAGSLNYTVPSGIDPATYRSVVIWCRPISSAYGAAILGAAR